MKTNGLFAIALLTLTFAGTAAADNRALRCDLRINTNDVKCPLIGFCPEKSLRSSNTQIAHELFQGQQLTGRVNLSKVILFPGTDKQDRHSVFLFNGDERATKLREEKEVDLVQVPSQLGVGYDLAYVGDSVIINFFSGASRYNMRFNGSFGGTISGFVHLGVPGPKDVMKNLPVIIDCRMVSPESINMAELEKQAIEEHLKKKAEQKQGTAVEQ